MKTVKKLLIAAMAVATLAPWVITASASAAEPTISWFSIDEDAHAKYEVRLEQKLRVHEWYEADSQNGNWAPERVGAFDSNGDWQSDLPRGDYASTMRLLEAYINMDVACFSSTLSAEHSVYTELNVEQPFELTVAWSFACAWTRAASLNRTEDDLQVYHEAAKPAFLKYVEEKHGMFNPF
ncbi:MAG: hypothetical protein LBN08_01585 [Lactobacillales bacterium]|jgi:hypothetical protein|nr:hypothetical protein [Lactobacillales bacterium]